jgi:propionyl-CoA synthetase
MPGYDVAGAGRERPSECRRHARRARGKLPLPPGTCPRCGTPTSASASLPHEFPGYYKTGDAGYVDEDGYVFVMARTDDIINVAGHRLSTGGDGGGAGQHPDVAECAVIGVPTR